MSSLSPSVLEIEFCPNIGVAIFYILPIPSELGSDKFSAYSIWASSYSISNTLVLLSRKVVICLLCCKNFFWILTSIQKKIVAFDLRVEKDAVMCPNSTMDCFRAVRVSRF